MSDQFAWIHEDAVKRLAFGGDVPEGIFYPVRPHLTDAEWRAEALAAGAALWRVIGKRQVYLVGTASGVWHALRTGPRGHGKRRRLWDQTSECGLMFSLSDAIRERLRKVDMAGVTCLSCRKTVRERAEREIRCEVYSPEFEASLEAYDQSMIEEWWRIQAEWHKPDPIPMWAIPADLNYSLVGG